MGLSLPWGSQQLGVSFFRGSPSKNAKRHERNEAMWLSSWFLLKASKHVRPERDPALSCLQLRRNQRMPRRG